MKEIPWRLNVRFTDESSSQDFFNASTRKLSDDQSDFVPINCKKFSTKKTIHFFSLQLIQKSIAIIVWQMSMIYFVIDIHFYHVLNLKYDYSPRTQLDSTAFWIFQTLLPSKPVLASTRGGRVNSKYGKGKPAQAYMNSDITNRRRVRRVWRRANELQMRILFVDFSSSPSIKFWLSYSATIDKSTITFLEFGPSSTCAMSANIIKFTRSAN